MEILSISRLALLNYRLTIHSSLLFRYFEKEALKNMVITRIYDNFFYM
jgi:hypothetical protein